MKRDGFRTCLFAACAMFLFGCGDSGGSGKNMSVQNRTVSGVSQKGPFIKGSTVTVQELNGESLKQTGNSFTGKISSDKGEFTVDSVSLASQYAFLVVNGFYRNEIAGHKSDSQITLNALVDISDRENVNINLLTHLEVDRVKYLVTNENMSFSDAKTQARQEILDAFGFSGNFGASEDLNIFGTSEDAAMLLAVSVIVQGAYSDHWESELTERLENISSDIADGTIDDTGTWQQMATWAMGQNLNAIRQNVQDWGERVPDFEKYVRAFWTNQLGLQTCDNIGELMEYRGVTLICTSDGWDRANNTVKCGNGQCESGENANNCPQDCYVVEFCGNGVCSLGEDVDSCPLDCNPYCGNGVCNPGETAVDCPQDCNGGEGQNDDKMCEGTCDGTHVLDPFKIEQGRRLCVCTYDGENYQWEKMDWDEAKLSIARSLLIIVFGVCNDDNLGDIKQYGSNEMEWCRKNLSFGENANYSCGHITQTYYVCKNNEWSIASAQDKLGVCNDDNLDEVKMMNGNYYGCKNNEWIVVSEQDYYNYILGICSDDTLDEVKKIWR